VIDRPRRRLGVIHDLVGRREEDVAIEQIHEEGDAKSRAVPSIQDDAGRPNAPAELDVGQILGRLCPEIGFSVESKILCLFE
jgi:hypothetical protein